MQIAIDGPVAAGKGTVSKLAAERLGFLYVDTGAMYRMTAYLGKQKQVDWSDQAGLAKLIDHCQMKMRRPSEDEKDGRLSTIILDGDDVSWKIRTQEISEGSSIVAQLPEVRSALVKKQQEIAQDHDVVMEGRDITYKVLPQAELKIYLTADDVVRAKRRLLELQTKGEDITFEKVYTELKERDARDMERSVDPLKIVPDAWVLDTSHLSIEEVVQLIVEKVKSLT